ESRYVNNILKRVKNFGVIMYIRRLIRHLIKYKIGYLFILFSLLIDLIGVFSVEGVFRIDRPRILIVVILSISTLFFLFRNISMKIFSITILFIQSSLNIVFKMVYVMQGQIVFSLAQLKFIKEGTDVVTKYKIDYLLLINYLVLLVI